MADYKETTVSGKSWDRSYQILILNPLGELPTVRYDEESVINLDNGKRIKQVVGNLCYQIDPAGIIELRDPETLQLTGETIPVATVHQALLSDYINRAAIRDSASHSQPQEQQTDA